MLATYMLTYVAYGQLNILVHVCDLYTEKATKKCLRLLCRLWLEDSLKRKFLPTKSPDTSCNFLVRKVINLSMKTKLLCVFALLNSKFSYQISLSMGG